LESTANRESRRVGSRGALREFVSAAVRKWCEESGTGTLAIHSGDPDFRVASVVRGVGVSAPAFSG